MVDLWSSLGLGRTSPLEADLRAVTDAQLLDSPPKDALLGVTQASYDSDNRRDIMRHLRECLAETSGKRWRRIYGGLVLLEQLLQQGAPALVSEMAEGIHFDPAQRLTLLSNFEYSDDRRVQGMIRQKASTLRKDLLVRIEAADAAAAGVPAGPSTPGSASAGKNAFVFPAKAPVVVNGIVAAGHRDDTTSDSSEGEGRNARRGGHRTRARREHRRQGHQDSSDSDGRGRGDGGGGAPAAAKPATPPPPPPMDLLDF